MEDPVDTDLAIGLFSWRRLRIQLVAFGSFILIASLVLFTTWIVQKQSDRLLTLAGKEAKVLTNNLAATIVEWVVREDLDKMSEAALRAADLEQVNAIKILNLEGLPLSTIVCNEEGNPEEIFAMDDSTLPVEGTFLQTFSADHIVTWTAIEAEGTVGWIRLDYSLLSLQEMRKDLWRSALLFLALVVLVSVSLYWWFISRPLRVIEGITEFSSTLANMTGEVLPVDGRWRETQKLSNTLNDTAQQLRANWLALEEARSELEERVKQRTADLATTVNRLEEEMAERERVEKKLLHAQKMESVGQLAAGVAHEINTPMQFVSNNLRFIEDSREDLFSIIDQMKSLLSEAKKVPSLEEEAQSLEGIMDDNDLEYIEEELPLAISQSLDGAARVTKIVQAMKDFSHPSSENAELIDFNRAIESTVTLASNEWKYVAEVDLDLAEGLPEVCCYPDQLNQVVLNMIVNASHAIADSREGSDALGKITVSTQLFAKTYVEVSIRDDGSGIPEAARDKIFDPFFTTKEVGKGTGQGLSICYDIIVNQHDGSLTFETEEGKGTTFFIRIPLQSPLVSDDENNDVSTTNSNPLIYENNQ